MSEICGVYQIKNKEDGKRYIGSSKNCEKRMRNHKKYLRKGVHKNPHLQHAWNKYGEGSFQFDVVEECDERYEKEQEYFDAFISANIWDQLYNICKDARGGPALKGENHPLYGKSHSEETKKKMSEKLSGEKHPMHGKTHSQEAKRKMSESKKGKYSGKGNPNSKLTETQVVEIRNRYRDEDISYKELGEEYGVHLTHIGSIVRREKWKKI